jgi:hypothetical protein
LAEFCFLKPLGVLDDPSDEEMEGMEVQLLRVFELRLADLELPMLPVQVLLLFAASDVVLAMGDWWN